MLSRNTKEAYGPYESAYKSITQDAEKEFLAKVGTLTVFHKILIDRVADAYVAVLKAGEITQIGGDNKEKASELLTKWLRVSLAELHTAALEKQSRLLFFEKVVDIAEKSVADVYSRKELLTKLRDLVEERG